MKVAIRKNHKICVGSTVHFIADRRGIQFPKSGYEYEVKKIVINKDFNTEMVYLKGYRENIGFNIDLFELRKASFGQIIAATILI